MNESDAPESSSEKRVVFPKTIGRNSNGIGAGGSGNTSQTKEEAFFHARSRCVVLLKVIGLDSSRAMQLLRSGVVRNPPVPGC